VTRHVLLRQHLAYGDRAVAAGVVDLDRLVSSRHTLDQTAEALVAGRSDAKAIKAVILPQR